MPDADLVSEEAPTAVEGLISNIDGESFRSWRHDRDRAENIREGKPYFNGPPQQPPAGRHSPSRLLKCHRKIYYRTRNAPRESREPAGIFWIGSQFETEIAVPYLQQMAGPQQYVRNSIWITYTLQTDERELEVRGSTDPVIVDPDSTPLLLTEIKTTSSIDAIDGPKRHHRAQVHAYLEGLSREYDRDVREALLLYGGRENLDLKAFHVTFDESFWTETVVPWMLENTRYRGESQLPPAAPEAHWECQYCAYRTRCGETDAPHADMPAEGLLPLTEYPRQALEEYLAAVPEATLTPTTARQYPELAEKAPVADWECTACGRQHAPSAIDWDGDATEPPLCPACRAKDIPAPLAGPTPTEAAPNDADQEGS